MYQLSAQLRGLRFVGVPLTPDFELDEAAMLAAIEAAPPGTDLHRLPEQPHRQPVRRRASSTASSPPSAGSSGLVVFDEAYQPFCVAHLDAAPGRSTRMCW